MNFIIDYLLQRGWTTWLTGAIDKRVFAIVPVVMDQLNVVKVLVCINIVMKSVIEVA